MDPGVDPEDRAADVAARSLLNRLSAVLRLLPMAAREADQDTEYVHQLRVWARRADAALCLYKELLSRRQLRWMKKQLKRVRRVAGDARDCDVLLQRLGDRPAGQREKRWRDAVRTERHQAQKVVAAAHGRLSGEGRFAARIGKLLRRLRKRAEEGPVGPAPFGAWAREKLRAAVGRFFAAVPSSRADERALHQLRIRGKELRYTIELLAGAFPEGLRAQLYPAIEAIQDRLGQVNDLATAQARLREKLRGPGRRNRPPGGAY